MAVLVCLGLTVLPAARALSQPSPVQLGGSFAFPYPNFTGAPGAMTAQQYVQFFSGGYHNPNAYAYWLGVGTDIRDLNPNGIYFKHINLRLILDGPGGSAIGSPDYNYVKYSHPEWIIKDRRGVPVTLWGYGEALDFGNDPYLDWALNAWMPTQYLDATDWDPTRITWHMLDAGHFDRMYLDCAPADPVCNRYNTDEGMRTAWENLLRRFKGTYPNKRIIINTSTLTYKPIAEQMAVFTRIFSLADGYFSELLTNDLAYFDNEPNDGKRTALLATMALASWLADTGKVFFPNLGLSTGTVPTQPQIDYAWAFFNLMRKGDMQFFSRVTKDAAGNWAPMTYPEMYWYVGEPTELATELSPNVWRRAFTAAIAYVNLSDTAISIPLPSAGRPFMNSLGQVVNSPLMLRSFSGLTVYKAWPPSSSAEP